MSDAIALISIEITVNGKRYQHEVEPRMLLVEFIRETLALTGTHVGCDTSYCGACTIILNGEVKLEGEPIQLIERMKGKVWKGLVEKSELSEIEKENDVISSRLYMGKVQVRIFSESPLNNGYEATEPEIEDLYFATIHGLNINGEF